MLEMCNRPYETQENDMVNNIIEMLALKYKTYKKKNH